jgi:hypothetical protein
VFQIVEEDSWREAAAEFGGLQNVDKALEPIYEALMLNPAGFPELPGHAGIRIAKTDRVVRDNVVIVPALRVWVRFRVGDQVVGLLYAEELPNAD